VVLRVRSPCRGMVVLADAWFPGWKAFVDGKPARIYRAYNLVRAVVVDGGDHEVIMLYRPASVFIGAFMAVLGVLLCATLQFHRTDRDKIKNPKTGIEQSATIENS
jgi:uncharacterized membrane protein YfhO